MRTSVQCTKNLAKFCSRPKQMLSEVEWVSRLGSESDPNLQNFRRHIWFSFCGKNISIATKHFNCNKIFQSQRAEWVVVFLAYDVYAWDVIIGFCRSSMVGCCIIDIILCIDQVISGSGILFCNKSSCIERVAGHSLTILSGYISSKIGIISILT